MIKIPGNEADGGELDEIYDSEFFRQHAGNIPVYKRLAGLIDEVNEYNHERSVIDVGCGHGFLVESLRERGYSRAYGFEGSSSAESLWPEQYKTCYTIGDLTDKDPTFSVKKTDIVCSFEVGEHIHAQYAGHYVHSLTQHRPALVFFGAATALQDGGKNSTHVNERPFLYWIDLFEAEQYELDILRTVQIKNSMFEAIDVFNNAWWYPKNILIFQPKSTDRAIDDKKIVGLFGSDIKWFDKQANNNLFSICFVRDKQEYNYIIMDAVAKSVKRLQESI